MLKHEYLKNTSVATKFGSIKVDGEGAFKGLTEAQEIELSKSADTKLIKVRTTTTTTTKKPRKPRTTSKSTTTKKE